MRILYAKVVGQNNNVLCYKNVTGDTISSPVS